MKALGVVGGVGGVAYFVDSLLFVSVKGKEAAHIHGRGHLHVWPPGLSWFLQVRCFHIFVTLTTE